MANETTSPTNLADDRPVPQPCVPDGLKAMEREFAAYVRELPRLLATGHANRYALIKADEIVSIWDTQRDVLQAGHQRFGLESFAVKRIDPHDVDRIEFLERRKGMAWYNSTR